MDDAEAILAAATARVDRHDLPGARRLLAPLVSRNDLPVPLRARVLLEWGWLLGAEQRHEEAAAAFAEVVTLTAAMEKAEAQREHAKPRSGPDYAGLRSEALLEAGISARYAGRLDDADQLLVACGAIAAGRADHLREGQALAQRAAVAHQRHDFVRAREHLDALAALLPRCPPHDRTEQLRADWAHRAAVSARLAFDFDRARELLTGAGDRYAALGRRIGAANIEREKGAVLDQVGDEAGARQAYTKAFALYLRAGSPLGAAHAARRLGQMRLLKVPEDPDAAGYARRRFEQALRLGAAEPGNRLLCALFLARLERLTGDLDAAHARLAALPISDDDEAPGRLAALPISDDDDAPGGHAALPISDDDDAPGGHGRHRRSGGGPDPRHLSQAVLEWGMLERARGDRATAIGSFRQALALLDADRDPSAASIAHYQLAFDLIQDDEVAEAKRHAVEAFRLSEEAGRRLRDPADRETFYRDTRQAYVLALHCAARDADGETAFRVSTAARAEAVAAFIRQGARFSPELHALVTELALARRTPGAADRLPELHRRLDRLATAELRRGAVAEPVDLAATRASLPPGGHALLVDVLEDETSIANRIWLAPDGTVTVDEVTLPPRVRAWLDRYHAAEAGLAATDQDDDLAALGAAVVPAGLARELERGGAPALVISTGGVLGPVPVAAIRIGGRYLVELARIAVVPAIGLWTALRGRPPRPGAGVAAHLDDHLPGTRRERRFLEEAFPGVRMIAPSEIRPLLAGAAGLAAVVLSVHGTAAAGLDHALTLAPGDALTAADLLTCRLPEAMLMPACWAGRLDLRAAAEPLGLPTAALLAGARWVLAGTVDIATTTTASLLGAFYRELAGGAAPVDALRAVQLGYLRRRGPMPPATWAGLSVVGDGFPHSGAPSHSQAVRS
ncbi:CHAT domain-containing protein [Actinoplanes sp. NPDC023714]|uniref:CHAT domain-containing protein n=1 Tax=Actinoplanes sp. NPDC023714 TaxID=3154322 RepID=UPI0033DF0EAD